VPDLVVLLQRQPGVTSMASMGSTSVHRTIVRIWTIRIHHPRALLLQLAHRRLAADLGCAENDLFDHLGAVEADEPDAEGDDFA
jgi:hypothetical protein